MFPLNSYVRALTRKNSILNVPSKLMFLIRKHKTRREKPDMEVIFIRLLPYGLAAKPMLFAA